MGFFSTIGRGYLSYRENEREEEREEREAEREAIAIQREARAEAREERAAERAERREREQIAERAEERAAKKYEADMVLLDKILNIEFDPTDKEGIVKGLTTISPYIALWLKNGDEHFDSALSKFNLGLTLLNAVDPNNPMINHFLEMKTEWINKKKKPKRTSWFRKTIKDSIKGWIEQWIERNVGRFFGCLGIIIFILFLILFFWLSIKQ